MVTLEGKCVMCGKAWSVTVPASAYEAWQAGELIQNAMPMLSADERELLISGICGACFDDMFGGAE